MSRISSGVNYKHALSREGETYKDLSDVPGIGTLNQANTNADSNSYTVFRFNGKVYRTVGRGGTPSVISDFVG